MLSVINDIPDFCLSCELDDFLVLTDKSVKMDIIKDGRTIFTSTYVADANNNVHVRDLFSIIEYYLKESPLQKFSYTLSASGESAISKVFTVLLCRYAVSQTGMTFVSSHFLSNIVRKDTRMTDTEFLYLTNGSTDQVTAIDVNVVCEYFNTTLKEHVTENRPLETSQGAGINRIIVSPIMFNKSGHELLRYTVTAGQRNMTYVITDRAAGSTIRFKNAFGCEETFTFSGIEDTKPTVSRSSASINGKRLNYHVQRDVAHRFNSGFIPLYMAKLADDICAADSVSVAVGDQFYPVAITDSDSGRNNDTSALFAFWIEVISADINGFRMPEYSNIFDDTFDKSYN